MHFIRAQTPAQQKNECEIQEQTVILWSKAFQCCHPEPNSNVFVNVLLIVWIMLKQELSGKDLCLQASEKHMESQNGKGRTKRGGWWGKVSCAWFPFLFYLSICIATLRQQMVNSQRQNPLWPSGLCAIISRTSYSSQFNSLKMNSLVVFYQWKKVY